MNQQKLTFDRTVAKKKKKKRFNRVSLYLNDGYYS